MKYLLRILFVLALFCGVTSHARASSFHVGVVDPNSCGPNFSTCTIVDAAGPITGFQFTNGACNSNVPTAGGTPYCIVLFNQTLSDISSITLTIPNSALGGLIPICDTTTFFSGSCDTSGDDDVFSFTDGSFKPGGIEDIYVYSSDVPNFDPSFLNGATVTVAVATPEPDSLLLFGTGVMMAGLYMSKRQLLSAFGKK